MLDFIETEHKDDSAQLRMPEVYRAYKSGHGRQLSVYVGVCC